jgi:hypothetical protein
MAIVTSQLLAHYYNAYQDVDVTFTRDVLDSIRMVRKQVFFKCMGHQWPCVVYSSPMVSSRIILNLDQGLKDALKKSQGAASIRFAFAQPGKPDPITFFVPGRIANIAPYSEERPQTNFVALKFSQKPNDTLIEILGSLLDAHAASRNRRDHRILVTPEVARELSLDLKQVGTMIDNVPRRAILRDISFGGAKLILMGLGKMLVNKPILLHMVLDDPPEQLAIPGSVLRYEPVEGRPDLAALAVRFKPEAVPMSYKLRLTEYMRHHRIKASPAEAENQAAPTGEGEQ